MRDGSLLVLEFHAGECGLVRLGKAGMSCAAGHGEHFQPSMVSWLSACAGGGGGLGGGGANGIPGGACVADVHVPQCGATGVR